ncbi:class A beta-lactamase, subclass A2 [Fluviicola sp.]|uniref:class A beta-lactamase, subclass A2 n=1 Tax=Fluviicola sp. TaxID=1917219 RepID=UPI003D2A38F1
MNSVKLFLFFSFLLFGVNNDAFTQRSEDKENLKQQLLVVSNRYRATVGIGIIHIESGDTLAINNEGHFPMQSVYKFQLGLAVMNQVDKGKLTLNQKYHVTKKDLLDETWSPLKKEYPNGNVDLTVAQLLDYSVSKSDNIACDILFKLVGGTDSVNKYIHQLGINEMEIAATEHEMHADSKVQYTNWSTPMALSRLLEGFFEKKYLSDSSNTFLMNRMIESSNDAGRIKGMLPEATLVAHKTGTSDDPNGVFDACNDVGLITLPNGTHLALSVLVNNSHESYDDTRKLIAELSKVVFDFYSGK